MDEHKEIFDWQQRVATLEEKVAKFEELLVQVGSAMEQAKTNPMLKPLIRMFGIKD